jgi:hypothetical protein
MEQYRHKATLDNRHSYLLQQTQAVYSQSVCSLPCSSTSRQDMFVLWELQTDTGNICGSRWHVGKRSFLHRCGPSLNRQRQPSSWDAVHGCQLLGRVINSIKLCKCFPVLWVMLGVHITLCVTGIHNKYTDICLPQSAILSHYLTITADIFWLHRTLSLST